MTTYIWLLTLIQLLGAYADGENIANGKPVYGNANEPSNLVDGKLHTSTTAKDDQFPYLVVDLLDVYNVTKIHLYAQNENSQGNRGINVSFSLYGWDKPTCRCDFERYHPWNLIKGGLIFTRKGEEIVVQVPTELQYIVILTDIRDPFVKQPGMTLAEVKAFGTKIRDGLRGEEPPDDEPYPNIQLTTRAQLLKGQTKIWGQFSYLQCHLVSRYDDVALAWEYGRIGLMTAVRGKARTIFMAGEETLNRFKTRDDYAALRRNFGAWLTQKEAETYPYVDLTESYKEGDILLITTTHRFDVAKVYDDLKSGRNSAILVNMRKMFDDPSDLTKLMVKLNYDCHNVDSLWKDRELETKEFINSPMFIPSDYELRASLHSWTEFRSKRMRYDFTEEELGSKYIQSLIKQILEKYLDYFTYHGICRINVYHKNLRTHNAFLNFNQLLTLQRGDKVIIAPGVWNSPGGVHPSLKPTDYTVEFKVNVEGRYYPMGAYAKPGEAIYYQVLDFSYLPISSYTIRIGLMMDPIEHLESMARWPYVSQVMLIVDNNESAFPTAFGGPIVLWIPGNSTLKIRFKNVYRYPWYDARNKESVSDWENQRTKYKGAPFGIVMGDNMLSSLEMPSILSMDSESITYAINYYDNFIKLTHNFRGTDYKKAHIDVFSTDDQLAAADAHNGYPWVAYRHWAHSFGNVEMIKKGQQTAIPHEIGHNLQVGGAMFARGVEVANLIYTSVAHYYLLGLKAYDMGADPGCTKREEDWMVQKWNERAYTVSLTYYNYVGRLFGPPILANIFPHVTFPSEPIRNEAEKASYWISLLCKESGYDLVPFHHLWSFPITDRAVRECGQYPCFFPDDYLTQQATGVVDEILKDYGKQCQRTNPKQVKLNRDIMVGMNTSMAQEIFFPFK